MSQAESRGAQDEASGEPFRTPSKHVPLSLKFVSLGKVFLMLRTGTWSEVLFRGSLLSLFG